MPSVVSLAETVPGKIFNRTLKFCRAHCLSISIQTTLWKTTFPYKLLIYSISIQILTKLNWIIFYLCKWDRTGVSIFILFSFTEDVLVNICATGDVRYRKKMSLHLSHSDHISGNLHHVMVVNDLQYGKALFFIF